MSPQSLQSCILLFFLYSLNHHQASPTQSTFTAQLPPFLDFVSGDSTASSIFSFVHIYITMVSKLAFNSLALLASSSSVLAQFQGTTYNQTGPFLLQVVTADDDALVGKYLTTCHAGATITGLCIGSNDVSNFTLSFYYNYTIVNGQPSKTGFLTWSLPVPGAEGPLSLSEPMSLMFEPGSNVAVPMFTPSQAGTPVGWDNNTLFIAAPYDDSKFRPNVYPNATTTDGSIMRQLRNWHSCWVLYSAYYFNSVGWVSGGEPRNPTCEPVSIVRVDPASLIISSPWDELPDEWSPVAPEEDQDEKDDEADDDEADDDEDDDAEDEDASAEGHQEGQQANPEETLGASAEGSASNSFGEEHGFNGAVQEGTGESQVQQSQEASQGEQTQEGEQPSEEAQVEEHAEVEHAEEGHEGEQ
ncbi:hypothetical protein QC761_707170 [Podospora bellae-mahoneyi]|uniref:DUF7907 domain-containing protein n=1 Tax=Podospora bellae-mahoneyi TaxID=2093777 RepID=A0ABR0F8K7_9PEZI|nr:hypothetical protein QC761_707170 [Podospora bellae-mahoneyi]